MFLHSCVLLFTEWRLHSQTLRCRSEIHWMKGKKWLRNLKYAFSNSCVFILSCWSYQKSLTNSITWITPDGCVIHTKPWGLSLLSYKNMWRHWSQRIEIIVPLNGLYGKEEQNINEGTSKVCCSLKENRMQIQPLTSHINTGLSTNSQAFHSGMESVSEAKDSNISNLCRAATLSSTSTGSTCIT